MRNTSETGDPASVARDFAELFRIAGIEIRGFTSSLAKFQRHAARVALPLLLPA